MRDSNPLPSRRRFLAGTAAVALTLHAPRLGAIPIRLGGPNPDAWLDQTAGRHPQLFDAPEPKGGAVLLRMLDYLDTYARAYGVRAGEVVPVGALYAGTTAFALSDALWQAYALGPLLEIEDPGTGGPAHGSPWRVAPVAPRSGAGIEALQARGAVFLVCDGALRALAARLAEAAADSRPEALHRELVRGLLPGIVPVPSMVVTIERAQGRGVAYFRQ